MIFGFLHLFSWLPWALSRRDRESKEDHTVSAFYEAFLKERRIASEDEFCEAWENTPVVVKMTKAKVSKTTEIFCGPNKLTRRTLRRPITMGSDWDETVISDASFARRGAICIFVVRGKPCNFGWIDEHEWIRADNPGDARGKIYLMSEERFEHFTPREKAAH